MQLSLFVIFSIQVKHLQGFVYKILLDSNYPQVISGESGKRNKRVFFFVKVFVKWCKMHLHKNRFCNVNIQIAFASLWNSDELSTKDLAKVVCNGLRNRVCYFSDKMATFLCWLRWFWQVYWTKTVKLPNSLQFWIINYPFCQQLVLEQEKYETWSCLTTRTGRDILLGSGILP